MTLTPATSHFAVGPAGGPGAPYQPAEEETITVVENSDGDAVLDFDDDEQKVDITGKLGVSDNISADGDVNVGNDLIVFGDSVTLSSAVVSALGLSVVGVTGAVAGGRYVGFTASVAPTTGDFLVGDVAVSQDGSAWVCTVAGAPGTWVGLQSVLLAPLAAPTFTGHVTIPQGSAVLDAAALNQFTSALTITSGTLPNLGAWISGTAKQNPVTRQITAVVEVVTAGTATTAACTIAISADNSTFTTVGTPGVSTAVNTIGAQTLVTSVTIPAAWWIKLTFSNCTVAASVYY